MPNHHLTHAQDTRVVLHALRRYRWLRSREIAVLFFRDARNPQASADGLLKSLVDKHLVICRTLPERGGRAFLLSELGAAALREEGYEATSGQHWGRCLEDPKKGSVWHPPQTWKHQLTAAGILVRCEASGFEVTPEPMLGEPHRSGDKIPDGLIRAGDKTLWLEVEGSTKTGKSLQGLAQGLIRVASQGYLPTVAYDIAAMDTRGCAYDHKSRITAAVAAELSAPVKLLWLPFERCGPGVESFRECHEMVHPDRALRILKVLNNVGWKEDRSREGFTCFRSHHGDYQVEVTDFREELWSAMVWLNEDLIRQAHDMPKISEAKRKAAELLVGIADQTQAK
jgi:hypothetical protein